MGAKKKVGIVLFQLGGPDSLQAVEPFLLNLFLDPDIIPMGPLGFLRRPLAKLISSRRSIPVSAKYAEIGRRSPIGLLTERQRRALVKALSPDVDPVAVTAMRYWHPLTSEAIDELKRAGSLDEIVLLPLYPHFSYATTLSSLKEWNRVYGNAGGSFPIRFLVLRSKRCKAVHVTVVHTKRGCNEDRVVDLDVGRAGGLRAVDDRGRDAGAPFLHGRGDGQERLQPG